MNKFIGFTGKAGVGKSTIAILIEAKYGYRRRAFADPLKSALVQMTGLPMRYFTEIELKEKIIPWIGKSPRELMQLMGTDFVRHMINTDFWVVRMKEFLINTEHNIVIDDIRFPGEAQMIRDLGGQIVHLRRSFKNVTSHSDHVSENGVPVMSNDIVISSPKTCDEAGTLKMIEGLL